MKKDAKKIIVERSYFAGNGKANLRKTLGELFETDNVKEKYVERCAEFLASGEQELNVGALNVVKRGENVQFTLKRWRKAIWLWLLLLLLAGLAVLIPLQLRDRTTTQEDEAHYDMPYYSTGNDRGSGVVDRDREEQEEIDEGDYEDYVSQVPEIVGVVEQRYQIVYRGNGGIGAGATVSVRFSEGHVVLGNVFSRDGFEFVGWSRDGAARVAEFNPGDNISGLTNVSGGVVGLYAIWRRDVTVDFVGATSQSCSYFNNEPGCSITAPGIVRDGWTIVGWHQDADARSATVAAGGALTVTMGATFHPITNRGVSATFNGNGASGSSASESCLIWNAGTNCAVTTPNITRDGWTVHGWGSSPSGQVAQSLAGANLYISSDVTLYAITSIEHVATFNGNGAGVSGTANPSCTRWNEQANCTVNAPGIVRAGWNIHGWHQLANHSSSAGVLAAGSVITLTGNQTFYAITNTTHTATFGANGATAIGATSLSCERWNTAANCTVTAPTITRAGWTIRGWHESAGHNSAVDVRFVGSNISLSNNASFHAITSIIHTATFNANGASLTGTTNPMCMRWNEQASCTVFSPTITRAGWLILGWNTSAGATTASIVTGGPPVTVTLTGNATWYAITVQVLNFPFTGAVQTIELPAGTYHLQVWGAQGGAGSFMSGGNGGFAEGVLEFSGGTLYIVVGGAGTSGDRVAGGFNGGGLSGSSNTQNSNGISRNAGSGGGATHISLGAGLLSSVTARNGILVVAGGGGGGRGDSVACTGFAGVGGGVSGGAGTNVSRVPYRLGGGGGTSVAGGVAGFFSGNTLTVAPQAGGAGVGGAAAAQVGNYITGGGGGGGWFGGGGGWSSPGGGGSAHLSSNIITSHGVTRQVIPGNQSMPNPVGGVMIGNMGNGFARITRVN